MDETPAGHVWRNSSQPCMTSLDEYMQARIRRAHSFYLVIDDFGYIFHLSDLPLPNIHYQCLKTKMRKSSKFASLRTRSSGKLGKIQNRRQLLQCKFWVNFKQKVAAKVSAKSVIQILPKGCHILAHFEITELSSWGRWRLDQMALILFYLWPFTTMTIYPEA